MDVQIEMGRALTEAGRARRRALRRQRVTTAREERRAVRAFRRWQSVHEPMPKGRTS